MNKIALYVLTGCLLALGAFLRSPSVAISAVILWGFSSLEMVFAKAERSKDIDALIARADAYEKKHKLLEMDIRNVADRAKTILGETY